MARPTKCTPEVIEEFARHMRVGLYLEDACGLVGIVKQTAYNWLQWGEAALLEAGGNLREVPEEQRAYAEFLDAVTRAEATAISNNLLIIERAAAEDRPGDWRAAAWFIERRKPRTWGKQEQRHELTGADGGPVQVEHLAHLSDAELDAIIAGDGDAEAD